MSGELTQRSVSIAARVAALQARKMGRVMDAYGAGDLHKIRQNILRSIVMNLDAGKDPMIASVQNQVVSQVLQDLIAPPANG